ncbi:MAG: hypothetical protein IKQ31_02055 [Clostridia bacterium]|nr:hypothetical protein [Clostridia bacterium]
MKGKIGSLKNKFSLDDIKTIINDKIGDFKSKFDKIDWENAAETSRAAGLLGSMLAICLLGVSKDPQFFEYTVLESGKVIFTPESLLKLGAIVATGLGLGELGNKVCIDIGKRKKARVPAENHKAKKLGAIIKKPLRVKPAKENPKEFSDIVAGSGSVRETVQANEEVIKK